MHTGFGRTVSRAPEAIERWGQYVGSLTEVPALLRALGVDPARALAGRDSRDRSVGGAPHPDPPPRYPNWRGEGKRLQVRGRLRLRIRFLARTARTTTS